MFGDGFDSMMERCAHSGPEANGPCDACAMGPAPLPPDPGLSFSQRFSHTEWGAPIVPAAEITFDALPRTRKWSGVAIALGTGIVVVALLIATLMVGTGGRRGHAPTAEGPASTLTPSTSPAASVPASGSPSGAPQPTGNAAKPEPGPALLAAMIDRVEKPNVGFHTTFTMHIAMPGQTTTITGDMDLASPDMAATMKITGATSLRAEYILKDGVAYAREHGGQWQRSTTTAELPSSPMPARADLSGLEYVGVRKVDGRKLHLYRADMTKLVEDGVLRGGYLKDVELRDVRFELLVTPDAVPVSITASMKMKVTSNGENYTATMDMAFDISRFGQPIVIKAPKLGSSEQTS